MKQNTHTLYLQHFELQEAPFKITPTTDFFYGGGRRGEILHALLYGINVGEGIMMVTGEVGSGKTMLLRTLLERLPDTMDIIYIANPSLSGREILYNICEELGLHVEENRPDTVRMLQSYLIEQHTKNRRVIAFIDEAQAVPDESLEEIRLLSNLETSRDKLLQIVLFGQPELEEKLSQQSMRQLRERITVAINLEPFDRNDIGEYIATRLRAAGHHGAKIFSDDACHLIAVVSQGLSRRINVLADKALLSAFERASRSVNYADVRRAVKDVKFGKMRFRSEQSRRISKVVTAIAALASCALLTLAFVVRNQYSTPETTQTTEALTQTTEALTQTTDTLTQTTEALVSSDTSVKEPVSVVDNNLESVTLVSEKITTSPSLTMSVEITPTPLENESASVESDFNQGMVSLIAQLQKGEQKLTGEQLSQQIIENAEPHSDSPQTTGGNVEWQNVVAVNTAVVKNNRWGNMPASSYLRSRLNATEEWLTSGAKDSDFTARLITVSQSRSLFLEKFLRYLADFYPIRNTMVYPINLKSGKKFVVTFGVYPSRADAEIFVANIPRYFTGGNPYAQSITHSKQEAKEAWKN